MNDTSDCIKERYRRMLLERSGEERMIMGSRMFDAARTMVLASLPDDLSPAERRVALLRRIYGNDFDASSLDRISRALLDAEV